MPFSRYSPSAAGGDRAIRRVARGDSFRSAVCRNTRPHRAYALIILCCVLVVGCTGAGDESANEEVFDPAAGAGESILPMTITEWMFPPGASTVDGDPVGIAHLSITPMEPGENSITVELTDMRGNPLEIGDDADVTLRYRALAPESTAHEAEVAPVPERKMTWETESIDLPDHAWYAFDVELSDDGTTIGATTLYMLIPDPSVHGSDAPDLPESNPEAEEIYHQALNAYADWDAARWRESLGSGTDVVVVTRYAVTNRAGEEPAMHSESIYSGAFRPRPDGSTPAPPRVDFAERITIGDRGWAHLDEGTWEENPSLGVSTFADRAGIYEGATNIQLGGTATINGTETTAISFYLPQKEGQSEAWFVWWVDPDTGDPVRIMMVARMHFMIWDFHDVNGSYTITPPPSAGHAPPAGDG